MAESRRRSSRRRSAPVREGMIPLEFVKFVTQSPASRARKAPASPAAAPAPAPVPAPAAAAAAAAVPASVPAAAAAPTPVPAPVAAPALDAPRVVLLPIEAADLEPPELGGDDDLPAASPGLVLPAPAAGAVALPAGPADAGAPGALAPAEKRKRPEADVYLDSSDSSASSGSSASVSSSSSDNYSDSDSSYGGGRKKRRPRKAAAKARKPRAPPSAPRSAPQSAPRPRRAAGPAPKRRKTAVRGATARAAIIAHAAGGNSGDESVDESVATNRALVVKRLPSHQLRRRVDPNVRPEEVGRWAGGEYTAEHPEPPPAEGADKRVTDAATRRVRAGFDAAAFAALPPLEQVARILEVDLGGKWPLPMSCDEQRRLLQVYLRRFRLSARSFATVARLTHGQVYAFIKRSGPEDGRHTLACQRLAGFFARKRLLLGGAGPDLAAEGGAPPPPRNPYHKRHRAAVRAQEMPRFSRTPKRLRIAPPAVKTRPPRARPPAPAGPPAMGETRWRWDDDPDADGAGAAAGSAARRGLEQALADRAGAARLREGPGFPAAYWSGRAAVARAEWASRAERLGPRLAASGEDGDEDDCPDRTRFRVRQALTRYGVDEAEFARVAGGAGLRRARALLDALAEADEDDAGAEKAVARAAPLVTRYRPRSDADLDAETGSLALAYASRR